MTISTERPWLRTRGLEGHEPIVLEPSTPLADLAETVAEYGDVTALSYYGWSITWAEFDRLSTAFAAYLASQGIEKGDRVGVYDQNTPAFCLATYGIWKAGASLVPLNPMYRDELSHVFADAEVKGLVVSKAAYFDRVKAYADQLPLVVLSDDTAYQIDGPDAIFSMFADLPATDLPVFHEVVEAHRDADFAAVEITPEDTALIGYTSGTSGRSKGAAATHAGISSNSRYVKTNSTLVPKDGVVSLAPLFHITGFVCQFVASAAIGCTLHLNYRFDPAALLALLKREKPVYMAGPATVFTALMAHPDFSKEAFASFRSVMSGGAALPEGLVKKFEEKSGIYIGQGYGLTETCAQIATVPRHLRAPVDPESGNLSCGLPQPDTTVRILGDDGTELGYREVGEVAVSGPQVVSEYINNPEATAESIPNGELRTGDVGFMDENGWLFIVDRKKDMINASGFKVWPREVEDVLYTHPAVREGAVVGVSDAYRGESVVAYVSLQPGAEVTEKEIVAYCREHLASYKAPHSVTFVDELPKTSSGKILRRTVRAEAEAAKQAAEGSADS